MEFDLKNHEKSSGFKENIKELSILQRSMQTRIESSNDEESRTLLKRYRNRIITEIHNIFTHEENEITKNTMHDFGPKLFMPFPCSEYTNSL